VIAPALTDCQIEIHCPNLVSSARTHLPIVKNSRFQLGIPLTCLYLKALMATALLTPRPGLWEMCTPLANEKTAILSGTCLCEFS
jgi:hypothetical protein